MWRYPIVSGLVQTCLQGDHITDQAHGRYMRRSAISHVLPVTGTVFPGIGDALPNLSFGWVQQEETRKVMDNMQILHKCKDLKNNHFRKWKNCTSRSKRGSNQGLDQVYMDEMIDHTDSAESYCSCYVEGWLVKIADRLMELENTDLFRCCQMTEHSRNSGRAPKSITKMNET